MVFIAFLALFSIDVFGNGLTFWETVLGLFMHNIPVFGIIALLVVAWKRELVGAVAFAIAGLAYIISALMRADTVGMALLWSLIIAGPAFLIGFLFYRNWAFRRRQPKKHKPL
jgi:hypothetical protein